MLAQCNASFSRGDGDISYDITKETGVTTHGATSNVIPEIIGKPPTNHVFLI